MASGKINGTCYHSNGSATDNYLFYAEYSTGTPSIADNYTPVTVALKVCRNPEHAYDASAYNLNGVVKVSLSIDGTEVFSTSTAKIDTRNGQVWTFTTQTKNVTHKDDGSKTVSISASFSNVGANSLSKASLSGSVELEDIARASEPTVSDDSVQMGSSVTITTNRKASSLTHTLTYSFNGATGTIATGVGASYKWTVPDLASKISGKTSGTCTITCKTYSGTKLVGTETVDLTLTIPNKSTPSASASTVKMGTSVKFYTNQKSSHYRHTLTYEVGNARGTVGTSVKDSVVWTPPKHLADNTGNKTSATCKITCETFTGSRSLGTSTTEIILGVPDATVPTLSASSIVLGDSIIIYTPREADCYEHYISYTLKADGSSTVAFSKDFNGPVQESYEWTPSLTMLAPEIPSATKGTITITCTTRFKDSTTVVGTVKDAVSFKVTVPDNSTTKPKVTMTLSPVSDLPSAFSDVYVAGKSKAKVSYSATTDYSTIKSYLTEMLGKSSNSNPYTSAVLANSGTVEIAGKVTDARGYATTKAASITVHDYSRPRIIPGEGKSNIICTRSNSSGTADPGGLYLLIQIGRKYSKVVSNGTQKNFCKLSYQWKTEAQDESAYSDPVELLAGTATSDYVSKAIPNVVSSNTTAYTIRLIAEDDVGEKDMVTFTIPTVFATWHSPPGGHGFTLGGFHDSSKKDVFDCRFDAEFQGNVTGKVLGLGKLPEIPENADLNDYKDFGVYAVDKNATAKTLLNCPSGLAGTLRVWSANGSGATTGNYVYIMQEYICYDNSGTYRRSIQLPSPDEVWEYGDWKLIGDYSEGVTDIWRWRKYSDGTAECWGRKKNAARDITTEFGSLYYGNCDEVTFPFSFFSAPVVNATVESGTALILMSWQGTDGNGTATATKPASYRVVRPTTITGASFTIAYHAIGRWKE